MFCYSYSQYIKKYNSWLDGYNQSVGGEGFIKNDPTKLINELYTQGLSLENIAKKTCCSVEKVRRLLFRTNSNYLKKPVCTFNSDGDFLKKYSCVEELSEQEGYSIKQIFNSIKQNKAINGISFSYDCPFQEVIMENVNFKSKKQIESAETVYSVTELSAVFDTETLNFIFNDTVFKFSVE